MPADPPTATSREVEYPPRRHGRYLEKPPRADVHFTTLTTTTAPTALPAPTVPAAQTSQPTATASPHCTSRPYSTTPIHRPSPTVTSRSCLDSTTDHRLFSRHPQAHIACRVASLTLPSLFSTLQPTSPINSLHSPTSNSLLYSHSISVLSLSLDSYA